jgi:hypothetical protein
MAMLAATDSVELFAILMAQPLLATFLRVAQIA